MLTLPKQAKVNEHISCFVLSYPPSHHEIKYKYICTVLYAPLSPKSIPHNSVTNQKKAEGKKYSTFFSQKRLLFCYNNHFTVCVWMCVPVPF